MMDFENLIRVLNLFLALLCIYPATSLLYLFWKDGDEYKNGQKKLNTGLLWLFVGIVILSLINSILYLMGILGLNGGHNVSVLRSTVTNVIFLWVTWQLYLIHKSK